MQLRRLEVRNIRSYEDGRVDFAPGTTLIVGDVGAGKTSLLYAIEMALFGVAEVDAAYLVRHGAAHAEVAVRFEDGEHRYDVGRRFRRMRRKGRESFESERITFREDGRETSYSATEVRQRVIGLLGFPDNPNPQAHSDLWRWAIYVPQEKMREILSARPQDRLETIRKALGVERYRTAAENAQEVGADLRAGARHRRESAERLAHYDLEYSDAQEAADRLRTERGELERAIASATADRDGARRRLEEAERLLRERESDRRELESLERQQRSEATAAAEMARLAAERAELKARRDAELATYRPGAAELAGRNEALAAAERAARSAREELDRHSDTLRQLAAARAELAGAEHRRDDAAARRAGAESKRDLARTELERSVAEGPSHEPPAPTPDPLPEIERRLAERRSLEHATVERLARARAALGEIDELLRGGVCPRCHQAVRPDDFASHQREAADAVRTAEAERLELAGSIEALDAERKSRERYDRAHDRWRELERRRQALREALLGREAEVEEAVRSLAAAEAAVRAARETVDSLAPVEADVDLRRAAVEAADAAVRSARDAAERARRAAERVRATEESLAALSSEEERAVREEASLRRRLAERDGRIAALRASTSGAEDGSERLRASRDEAAAAERRLAEASASLVRADTRLDGEARRAASAEKGRAERAALIAEAVDLEKKAAWVVGPFRLHLLSMEQQLLAHAQATFDRAFQRFFASLVDDPALVAQTDVGFTPEVMIDGEPTPAEALSGGERTALALAFRLALASVVRSLGDVRLETLLLDEPTDGFSAEQVVRMGELLAELALPQVVIVSHESQLAGIADRTIRVRKVDGRAELEGDRADDAEPLLVGPPPRRTRAVRLEDGEPAAK